jgi:hypothetical protein
MTCMKFWLSGKLDGKDRKDGKDGKDGQDGIVNNMTPLLGPSLLV